MKNVWKNVPNIRYFIYHPLRYFNDIYYAIKWSFQRVFRGYCDCDWFNFNNWFQEIVPSMLRNMINGAGHPFDMEYEDWNVYLAEMAQHIENTFEDIGDSMNQYDIHNDTKKWMERSIEIGKWQEKEIHEGLRMLADRFFDLWD